MISDPIADLLVRIKNAKTINQKMIIVPYSKSKLSILSVLKKNGYVSGIKEDKENKNIEVSLDKAKPMVSIKRISKPGKRVYTKSSRIPCFFEETGIIVISTPIGILSGEEARKMGHGGELICEVR
ncbi:30S ribosomal protein S8 [Candidatus Berkelbacteria bacterium CG10_big_fil_rev_8_21_14_0_10_41_12]|uniref:Small ribosomal subunit protein uS8 n=1 Tax=Candidatus Berkelbacteria bacterium CG10_big_fil_rev_8_21_14_0_10_41_12 TaxID=1974513 RepID=A0A2M6WXW2_9BACT|nr:MAG: 30S ribosomal protein S8 [Candidatus Berkelbacteria bacterium CG10_big_fil_rev_8_21_14_0_10_41_12]